MLLTNQIIAFHSIKEVLLVKAAEGRLSEHLQQITRFHLSMLLTNIYLYIYISIYLSISIYKEECMFVCLFFMHSVPVIAIVTKLFTIFP
jgi:flagellar assembly factor FliW